MRPGERKFAFCKVSISNLCKLPIVNIVAIYEV